MKKIAIADMTFCVIMALCIIGLSGCSKKNSDNSIRASVYLHSVGDTDQSEKSGVVDKTTVVPPGDSGPQNDPGPVVIPNQRSPQPLVGWNSWPSTALTVTRGAGPNTLIINSNGRLSDSDGFNFNSMRLLRGKTLILEFVDTEKSRFNNDRMMKLGKSDKKAFESSNIDLLEKEYLPAISNMPMEFMIPDDFDGYLEFVFYQAELNDLKITAYYK